MLIAMVYSSNFKLKNRNEKCVFGFKFEYGFKLIVKVIFTENSTERQ